MSEEHVLDALERFIKNDDVQRVRDILQSDASLADSPLLITNWPDGTFKPLDRPLHYAAWQGADRVIGELLQRKVDVNSCGENDYTPLHYAVEHGKLQAAELLLKAGADANLIDRDGDMPIHVAFKNLPRDEYDAFCRLLLEHGARLDVRAAVQASRLDAVREHLTAEPDAIRLSPHRGEMLDDVMEYGDDDLIDLVHTAAE